MSMRAIVRRAVFLLLVALLPAAHAAAQTPAVALRKHLEAGTAAEGVKALEAMVKAAPQDGNAVLALGMAQFALAVERYGRSLHRYGFVFNQSATLVGLRLPVPINPSPEPLTYEKMRAVFATYLADLAAVDKTLSELPAGDIKIVLDLYAVRLDLNGDGKGSDEERLGAILETLGMMRPGAPRRSGPGAAAPGASGDAPQWIVAFDRADGLWLRGYTRLIAAFNEFVLAHDWRATFDISAHHFFRGAAQPSHPALRLPRSSSGSFMDEAPFFADLVAWLHLARWPIVEPARMKEVRRHFKAVIALSRETWKEVLAETDDDNEWLPAPRQSSRAVTAMPVGEEQVKGWLAALDEMEAVLDGTKLLPHWRLSQGFDLKQVLEEPRPFDLVLWITGHAALPYTKPGETISARTWANWQRVFGGNFLAYAIWFN